MSENTTTYDYRALAKTCMGEHYWPYYVVSIVASFLGGLFFILTHRVLIRLSTWITKRRRIVRYKQNRNWHTSGGHRELSPFIDINPTSSQLSGLDKPSQEIQCGAQYRELRVPFTRGERFINVYFGLNFCFI